MNGTSIFITITFVNLSKVLFLVFFSRYWAITDPITYPQKMSKKRSLVLIAVVWVLSSAISFPAILWWNYTSDDLKLSLHSPYSATVSTEAHPNKTKELILPFFEMINSSNFSRFNVNNFVFTSPFFINKVAFSTAFFSPIFKIFTSREFESVSNVSQSKVMFHHFSRPINTCFFTEDPGYLIISSTVSFYLPMVVIFYAYYHIYKAAMRQKKILRAGALSIENIQKENFSDFDHFKKRKLNRNTFSQKNLMRKDRKMGSFFNEKATTNNNDNALDGKINDAIKHFENNDTLCKSDCIWHKKYKRNQRRNFNSQIHHPTESSTMIKESISNEGVGPRSGIEEMRVHKGGYKERKNLKPQLNWKRYREVDENSSSSISLGVELIGLPFKNLHSKHSSIGILSAGNKKNFNSALKQKILKTAKERKAAKTLGFVVGVFCICCMPFFVTNLLYGICNTKCVPHAAFIFPVFTWFAYVNSCMNPVIYAYSMRDFRRSFIKILCCKLFKQSHY